MKIVRCNICGGTEGRFLITCEGYDIVKCNHCGLVLVNKQFRENDLKKFYSSGYYTGNYEKVYKDYIGEKDKRIAGCRERVKQLLGYADSGRLLELGCAAGFFLEAAKVYFEVQGVEPSEFSSRYARETLGHKVHTGTLFSANFQSKYFDVVVMWDVIEPLSEPRGTLAEIYRLIKPQGILGLSTGNIDSFIARSNLSKWGLLAPPWHLYYFSKNTLCRLLRDIGFDILHLETNSHFTDSNNRIANNRIVRFVVKKLLQGDITTLYCRKRGH